jgi:hypothetical protein
MLEHLFFAAVKMRGPRRIDDEPVRWIGSDDRRIMLQRPDREALQRS